MSSHRLRIRHRVDLGMALRECSPEESRPEHRLLWIHGLGESGLGLEEVVAHPSLAHYGHVVADLPGYGRSPWSDEPLGLEDMAGHLLRWMDRGELEPLVLVGHSMGGVIGQILAERAPERFVAFVDVEGNLSEGDCVYSRHADGVPLEEWTETVIDGLIARVHREGVDDPALASYSASLRLCDPRAFHRNAVELVSLSRAEGLAGRLARLEVPSLYIFGSPGGTGARSRALLEEAGVEVAKIEDAGHWPHVDRTEAFAEVLARFLDRLPPRTYLT